MVDGGEVKIESGNFGRQPVIADDGLQPAAHSVATALAIMLICGLSEIMSRYQTK
jgi:hypothetical protein